MFCQSCGSATETSARFCQKCGAENPALPEAALGAPPSTSSRARQASDRPKQKSHALKISFIGCGLLMLLAAGGAVAVFYGIKYTLKSSDASKAAVQAVKQSDNAHKTLGEITDVGTPMGSISSEAGGSGNASLSMSVTGAKAIGTYYATLQRRNGQWFVVSGRIELTDGRSINVEAKAAGQSADVARSAGHQLSNDAADTNSWREVRWHQQHLRFLLPPDWIEKDEPARTRFSSGRDVFVYLPNGQRLDMGTPTAGGESAGRGCANSIGESQEWIDNRLCGSGSRRRDCGLLTISNVGDRRAATWKAIVEAGGAQTSLDISLGAQVLDFERLEPTFRAIFDSIRFE
jgi:hypothetical protein